MNLKQESRRLTLGIIGAAGFLLSASSGQADWQNRLSVEDLARDHAPILISRRDQIKNPETDRPLLLAYSKRENADSFDLIYTTFFSDEDSIRKTKGTEKQMARFGRRLDIEWTYTVRLNRETSAVMERTYHCAAVAGISHGRCSFGGKFEAETSRPILYVIARHNVFSDHAAFPQGTKKGRKIILEPELEISFPKSRDMVPLERPELLKASDLELEREGKLAHAATEYLFLRLRGSLSGRGYPFVQDSLGNRFVSSDKTRGSLKDMGLDLWGKESVVAIWIPTRVRRDLFIGRGDFFLGFEKAPRTSQLTLEDLGAYVVETTANGDYETIDLSSRIRCENPADLGTCRL